MEVTAKGGAEEARGKESGRGAGEARETAVWFVKLEKF